ncbi:GlcG/HbpS family heme-binding protein [Celeribacter litoreus]|uniref:GlcG/HbpS family heme-binding protein n=1 Tax=Celeribacter litoreus TaxID=2876714 RepID=UPI001CCD13D1|nr:heme-binding protein [Celeribacter litoreus]MCA0044537.1 heme-binding protein [Celeribacter litoreus]
MKSFKIMALCACLVAPPALAQDDGAFVTFKVLKPEVALTAATAAMESCRDAGYQVGVMVVDRFGIPQAYVRDRFAGLHVFETARRKAWTAVSFRTDTLSLGELTAPGEMMAGIRELTEPLALGGGLVIESSGSIVGGIGVSGAPGPDLDADCAEAGIDAIMDDIAF